MTLYWFAESASPFMNLLLHFSFYGFAFVTSISVLVGVISAALLMNSFVSNVIIPERMEIIWTLVPFLILGFLALPSLALLYKQDELIHMNSTKFAVGHQWYWSYEDPANGLNYDSYMSSELSSSSIRVLDADNRFVLEVGKFIRVLVTSWDVLHSWTVPRLGVKADAVPGRLNSLTVFMDTPSVLFGQCSEICGANHSFMPIAVEGYSE